MTAFHRDRRKIDPTRGDRLGDGSPNDNDRVEIGPTQGHAVADMFAAQGLTNIRVLPDLSAEMGKKSRYLPRHFEAMNTRLDRARSRHRAPFDAAWVAPSGPGTADARLRSAYFNGESAMFSLAIPDFGTMTGRFQISELAYGGVHDDQATFSIRLVSTGVVTFTAA